MIEGTVRPDGSCRWFEADVVAMTCCYPAHTGNEVSSCVGGVAEGLQVFVCVLALRKLCVLIGIDCGLPVDIRWPVGT